MKNVKQKKGINTETECYAFQEKEAKRLTEERVLKSIDLSLRVNDLYEKELYMLKSLHNSNLIAYNFANSIFHIEKTSPKTLIKHNLMFSQQEQQLAAVNKSSELEMDTNPCKWVGLCVVAEDIYLSLPDENTKKIFCWILMSSGIDSYLRKLKSTNETFSNHFSMIDKWLLKVIKDKKEYDQKTYKQRGYHSKLYSDQNLKEFTKMTRYSIDNAKETIKAIAGGLWSV